MKPIEQFWKKPREENKMKQKILNTTKDQMEAHPDEEFFWGKCAYFKAEITRKFETPTIALSFVLCNQFLTIQDLCYLSRSFLKTMSEKKHGD